MALVFCAPARAETTVWLGGSTDNNWSTAANWLNNSPPRSINTSDIVFAASPRTTVVQDIASPLTVRGLFFSDNPYTLSGGALAFEGEGAAIHNSTTLSIFNPIILRSNTSYNGTGDASFWDIGGPGEFTKNGSGTVTFLSQTGYAGDVHVNDGQISLIHAQALAHATVRLNADNGLRVGSFGGDIGNLTGTGNLNLGGRGISVGNNNTSQTYSGRISETGYILKVGDGAWTLTGAGSSLGRLWVFQGDAVLSGGSITVSSTGTHDIDRALTVGGGVRGSMTVQAGALLNTFASGAGRAVVSGRSGITSTMTVSGASSRWDAWRIEVGGTSDRPGTLVADHGGVINATDIFVGQPEGGTLLVQNGGVISSDRLTVSSGPASPLPTVSVRSNGRSNAAETILATPTSSIDVDRGTFATAMLTSTAGNGSITLRDPAADSALVISGTGASATYTGSIAGSGGITKNGPSTQTLSGQNTYLGPTTVNEGTLVLTNSSSSSYTVNGSGRLQFGSGYFGHSSLRVSGGGTMRYPATVVGGFVRGSDGLHDIKEVASFNGTTFAVDSAITVDNALALNNVTNSGELTANKPLTWNGGVNASAGRFTLNSEATVSSFENDGLIAIQRRGLLLNSITDLVSGGGSRITIDEGGSLQLNKSELHLNGSLLVNNGLILGTTNVNFGSLLTGTGEFGEVRLSPGGTFTPGVAFGAKANTSSDLATIVTGGRDQTVASPVTLLADTVAAVPSDTLRITRPMAAAGVKITKVDGGRLELKHVRARALAVDGGTVVIAADGTAEGVSVVEDLTIAAAGTLDLTDNDLRVRTTDAQQRDAMLARVAGFIRSARNGSGGRWTGGGLTSSAAAVNPLTTLAVGADANDVLVKYTYNGDANLDGRVNSDDYFRIDSGFLTQPADPIYAQGDFNYDSLINSDDYFLIDSAFLGQGAALGSGDELQLPVGAVASVPEPGVAVTVLACAAGVMRRRRRRSE